MADRQRGSALVLMPAAVLVLVTLAAITVDTAMVFLAERQLADAAAAAANDAAAALDDAAFYERGEVRVDVARAREVVAAGVAARSADWLDPVIVERVEVDPTRPAVTVELSASVRRLFGRAIPGARDSVAVGATATAVLE